MHTTRVFIIQPMDWRTTEEILQERNRLINLLTQEGYDIANPDLDTSDRTPFQKLISGLEVMYGCDKIAVIKWANDSKGCRVEIEFAGMLELEEERYENF